MGCDIHLYVEKKSNNGKWVSVSEHPYSNRSVWNFGRNYIIFGLLASVRVYNIIPIAEPKGLPSNISKSVAKKWENGKLDWHTPSWFTAKELLEAKDKPVRCRTRLNIESFKKYLKDDKKNIPKKYNWNYSTVENLISNEEMEKIINLLSFWDGVEYYTDVIWDDPNISKSSFSHLFDKILPAMLEIESNPEKIRIVFWFDN